MQGTVVVGVNVPGKFRDEIDFESILGRAFEGERFREWKRSNPVIVVARGDAYEELKTLMSGSWGDVPESTVAVTLRKHCMDREAVCLRWVLDS